MTKLSWVIAVMAVFVAVAGAEKSGEVPAPGTDCSVLVYDMIDCISYISVGGSDEKPSESCCSGFKTVVKTDDDCVCVALKTSGQLGIELNKTRVMAMTSACGASSSFSLSTCDFDPAPAPVSVPLTPTATAPAPVPATVPVPAPGPDIPTGPSPNTSPAPSPSPNNSPSPSPSPNTAPSPSPSPNTAPAPSPSPSPEYVWPPPPAAPIVEPPALSPSDNGGSSFNQSPAFSPESGTPSATAANPRLLLFCMIALAPAIFNYV